MRNGTQWFAILAMGLALCGCQSQDENTTWNPGTDFPDWTYDKPLYTEPAVEPQPYEKVANGIDVYYSRGDTFYVRRPGGKQPEVRPRTAVWYSYDGGNTWQKDGYYGLHQQFYTFYAKQDGQYWIRFVGPNMGVAEVPPGQPHEIHVVDTQAPVVTLEVDPPPFEEIYVDDEGNEVSCPPKCKMCFKKVRKQHIYQVGEKVTISWTVSDINLEPKSIELSTCFARFPHNLVWSRFKGTLDSSGLLEVVIPPEAATQAGMRFRMIAQDKAGNIGLGLSEIMDVQTATPQSPEESAQTGEVESMNEMVVEESPADTSKKDSADTTDLPEPTQIQKPAKSAPLGLPEPPADLTEPVNIEKPASQPVENVPVQSESSKPTPLIALEAPAAEKETTPVEPAPVVKEEAPKAAEPVAVEPAPVAKAEPAPAEPAPVVKEEAPKTDLPVIAEPAPVKKAEPAPVEPAPAAKAETPKATETVVTAEPTPVAKDQPAEETKTPTRTDTSIATMEREMEQAQKDQPAKAQPAEATESVPVKVLTQAPAESKPAPEWKPVPPTKKAETPATMKLSDIPEKVQQGWPAKDMTMQGGVSRLLNWLPESAAGHKAIELQFTSNDGKSWIPVAKDLQPNRVVTWTVPMVTSQTCQLRIVGTNADGEKKTLETSDAFSVDAGTWETIDMSGFKMQVPKSK